MGAKSFVPAIVAALLAAGYTGSSCADDGAGEWHKSLECVSGNVMWISGAGSGENVLFAGTGEGLYTSKDSGDTWQKAAVPPAVKDVVMTACNGSDVAFIASGSLYIGKDGDWKRAEGRTGLEGTSYIDGGSGKSVVLAWTQKELYELTSAGWKELGSPAVWGSIDDVASRGGKIFLVSDSNLFVSDVSGSDWTKTQLYPGKVREEMPDNVIDSGVPDDMAYDESGEEGPRTQSRIYAEGPDGVTVATMNGIYRLSVDGMVGGVVDTSGLPSKELRQVADTPEGLFAATSDKIFLHSDEGTWIPFFEPAGEGEISYLYYVTRNPGEGYLLAASGKTIYKWIIDQDLMAAIQGQKGDNAHIFDGEPSVVDVQRMAIEYAEVSPKKIQDWRNAAKWKAVMPKLSVDFGRDRDDNMEVYTSATSQYCYNGPDETNDGWDVGLEWDLSDLVWNDAQTSIDVRSKLMVQLRNDILEEVTRLYFERRRVIIETEPGNNDVRKQRSKVTKKTGNEREMWSMQEKEIRVAELTAHIDAYTGGKFSEALAHGKAEQ